MAVAIKKSRVSLRVERTILRHEARVLQVLQGHPAIPKLFGYRRVPHFEYIAIDLLGENLSKSCKPGHALCAGTVARIADQMSFPSRVCLIDFGIARHLTVADAAPTRLYDPIESNRHVEGTLHWSSINAHLGFDLRAHDDLEGLAYVILYLVMGDLPWRIPAYEPIRDSMSRILAAKQAFGGSTIPTSVPAEFRKLLDFAREARRDTQVDLAEIRQMIQNLASTFGGVENEPLDLTPQAAIVMPKFEYNPTTATTPGPVPSWQSETELSYSSSYFGMDIDCWDMRAGGDKSLTFPGDDAELLDGQILEIAVIDRYNEG